MAGVRVRDDHERDRLSLFQFTSFKETKGKKMK